MIFIRQSNMYPLRRRRYVLFLDDGRWIGRGWGVRGRSSVIYSFARGDA